MDVVLRVAEFGLLVSRLIFEGIGTYVACLVALDEIWWTRRRNWRYVTAGILGLGLLGLLRL